MSLWSQNTKRFVNQKKNYGFCSRRGFTLVFYSYITLFFSLGTDDIKKIYVLCYLCLSGVAVTPKHQTFSKSHKYCGFWKLLLRQSTFRTYVSTLSIFSDFLMFGCSWISMMRAIAYTTQQSNNILIILKFDNNFEINVIKIIRFMPVFKSPKFSML